LAKPKSDLRLLSRRDENIRRLDVAMDYAKRTGGGLETIGDLDSQTQEQVEGHRLFADAMFPGRTFEQFHGEERKPLMLIDFVNGEMLG
jgi:hypothetical protein